MLGGLIIIGLKTLFFSPMTYDGCISKYSKNTASDIAARSIILSCSDLTLKHEMKKEFNECILNNMQGVMNDVSAWAVMRVCRDKYPQAAEKSASTVPAPPSQSSTATEASTHQSENRDESFWKAIAVSVPDISTLLSDDADFRAFLARVPDIGKRFVYAVSNRDATAFTQVCNAYRNDLYYRKIKAAHPDFEKYVKNGEMKAWILSQPSPIKERYIRIHNEGSAEEVITLITAFKEAREANKSAAHEKASAPHDSGNVTRWVDENGNVHFSGTVGE